jgi:hypothetical protein
MSHVRKQIRDRVVVDLTNLATTGTKVFQTRFYPLATAKLPGLAVYTNSETVEASTVTRPRTMVRVVEVVVEGYAQAKTGLDDTMDQIGVEVEEAIAADSTLNGLVKDIKLVSVEVDYGADGEQPVGTIRMVFEATYVTLETDAETAR